MAFADWDQYAENRSNPATDWEAFGGQNWGAPVLHSALVNPLSGVGEGTYFRRLSMDGMTTGSRSATILASIGASVASGAYVGPDEFKAQEARAWMRNADANNATPNSAVAIGGRWTHTVTGAVNYRWAAKGYFLSFGAAAPDTVTQTRGLRLFSSSGGGVPSYLMVEVLNDPATAAPWLTNRWYRFRWRLTPTGLISDTMTAHRLVDGGNESTEGDWLLAATLTVSAALDPLYYCAPGAGTRYGFASSIFNNTGALVVTPYIDLVRFKQVSV